MTGQKPGRCICFEMNKRECFINMLCHEQNFEVYSLLWHLTPFWPSPLIEMYCELETWQTGDINHAKFHSMMTAHKQCFIYCLWGARLPPCFVLKGDLNGIWSGHQAGLKSLLDHFGCLYCISLSAVTRSFMCFCSFITVFLAKFWFPKTTPNEVELLPVKKKEL